MTKRFLIAAVLALTGSAGLAAVAQADDPPKHPCIFVNDIDDYQDVDDRTMIISTSPSKRFKVTFANRCDQMRFSTRARIVSHPGICLAQGDRLEFGRRDGFRDVCWITEIEQLPPEVRQTPAATP